MLDRFPIGLRKIATKEHLYLFLKGVDEVRQLSKQYMDKDRKLDAATRRTLSQQAFFKALESTYISELISEVRINVKALKVDGSLTFREMSEGEQQLLMVLGLLRFTREDESLFLLDEPDTHLNPAWSVQYLDFLRRIGGAQDTSHVIMATHDPLVVIGLKKEQVQVLHRDEESSQITAEPPTHDPKRMSIASLLTSDIYGLRSAMSLEMLNNLDDLRLLRSQETHSNDDKLEIERLEKELGGIDSTVTMRDPMYELFVQAMAERERDLGLDEVVLTPEQKEQQRAEAKEILGRLKSEANKK